MDQIANMLIGLKNASLVGRASVVVPHSKLKSAILEVLKGEGYVKATTVNEDGAKKTIEVVLAYDKKAPKIQGVARVSKPSKRVYMGVKEIKPIKYGHGLAVLSTPKGILTGKQARAEMVGGEILFTIW